MRTKRFVRFYGAWILPLVNRRRDASHIALGVEGTGYFDAKIDRHDCRTVVMIEQPDYSPDANRSAISLDGEILKLFVPAGAGLHSSTG